MGAPDTHSSKCVVCGKTATMPRGSRQCTSCIESTPRVYRPGAPLGQAESQMFSQVLENYGDSPEWPEPDNFPTGDDGLVAAGINPEDWKREVRQTPVFDGEAPGSAASDAWEGLRHDLTDAVAQGKKSLLWLLITSALAGALVGSLLLLIALQIGGRIK